MDSRWPDPTSGPPFPSRSSIHVAPSPWSVEPQAIHPLTVALLRPCGVVAVVLPRLLCTVRCRPCSTGGLAVAGSDFGVTAPVTLLRPRHAIAVEPQSAPLPSPVHGASLSTWRRRCGPRPCASHLRLKPQVSLPYPHRAASVATSRKDQ
uniref:Uncharacterized protein n=1 Tax=Arundo donax TaxID=35708 RepID=A0A0A8XMZ5_ARUDO